MDAHPIRILSDCLIRSTSKHPYKVALITGEGSYTYKQLLESSQRLAATLVEHGVKKGDRVALLMENTWECVVSIYAVQLCGAVFVVINPQTKPKKLLYLLNDSGAVALLTEAGMARIVAPILPTLEDLNVLVCNDVLSISASSGASTLLYDDVLCRHRAIDALTEQQPITLDLAALIYTSGTTGDAKGVMHTHQSMVFALTSIVEYLRLTENEVILCALPLAFDYGLYQLLMTIYIGGTLVLERSFMYPQKVLDTMKRYRVTVFPSVPTMFAMLCEAHRRHVLCFETISRVTNTAAALSEVLIPTLQEIFPNALIYKMYGLTECKRACYLEPELLKEKPASVGKPIPGTEMFLLSKEGSPVPVGEKGLLHIRGPHVMLGYWNKPDRTEEMIRQGQYSGDRILCTHDWFVQDAQGYFYFVSRGDDIIKSRGEKVSPTEIEDVLLAIEGVKYAAVVGVAHETLGEAILAFISPQRGVQLQLRSIKKYCSQQLEQYMMPSEIFILTDLPKTSNGKIDKKSLKRGITERHNIAVQIPYTGESA